MPKHEQFATAIEHPEYEYRLQHFELEGVQFENTTATGIVVSFEAARLDTSVLVAEVTKVMHGSRFTDQVIEDVITAIVRTQVAEILAGRVKVEV